MPANSNEPERPRTEPEILPPDHGHPQDRCWPPHGFGEMHGTQRIYVGRIGSFGFLLIMLVAALFAVLLLLLLIGTALIWIPVVAVFLVIAAISGVFRRL